MRTLSLHQCYRGISHVLDERMPEVLTLPAGPQHVDALQTQRPPLAFEIERRALYIDDDPVPGLVIAQADVARTLKLALDTHAVYPMADPESRAAAMRLAAAVLAVGHSRRSAARRVDDVHKIRPLRDDIAEDLGRVPPMVTVLLDEWMEIGDAIDVSLNERLRQEERQRLSGRELVISANRVLVRLRRDIKLSVDLIETLAPDLERKVFGYIDDVVVFSRSARASQPTPEPAPAEPAELEAGPEPVPVRIVS